ncbi:hypothetical protein N5C66_19810 [Rhizobium pusense]|uniref:hypothetical protein n=1 Tax=Agrobacterium pusense TaxID=648995 RepID=UPI000D1B008E|nr:hypothetical protein [Agrobacterium pusense]HCJ74476.1 hypothetical protein [Agrobacterium sp.]MDH0911455.1 hypothetical protein [Agrobacterium pusense]MDH1096684.1 hypothetical protein [Agrobacterium pusense]MDH1113992.1 hypothetical protein [Agrobacterium pusense]MDH2194272.1 hypothetical protein [Agrobacterium pusense]
MDTSVRGSGGTKVTDGTCALKAGTGLDVSGFHTGEFASAWRESMTYDWSGRRMRRMRAAKLTIISLVAAFVLTAPIFTHY